LGIILSWSRGKSVSHRGWTRLLPSGSISEKTCVTINGMEQGMLIKRSAATDTFLLFLHSALDMPA